VGYVSALDREINENGTPINMFQTDCAINSGNSGGPIFDMNGNVIGITTAKYSSSGSSTTASIEGIGFCIPSNDAMDIVSDLLEYGYVKGRPYLGITCQAISSTVTQYYNLPSGIYVNSVESGSAAEDAGLQQGDIITALDGTEVDSVTDFKALLKNYSAGDTATLTVYRSASGTVELSVTFGEQVTTTTSQTEETEEDTQDQQDQQQQQQPQQQNPWSYYGFGDMS
jgi:serine protease Do